MTGGFGGSMGGVAGLGGGGKGKRPISVKFEIPYFTTSGIQVRYLKIIEPKVSFVLCFFSFRGRLPPPLSPLCIFSLFSFLAPFLCVALFGLWSFICFCFFSMIPWAGSSPLFQPPRCKFEFDLDSVMEKGTDS